MKSHDKVRSNKNLKQNEKTQVRDTAGGEMPDVNRNTQTPGKAEVESTFNQSQNQRRR